jgi:hypothetical protein
MSEELAANQKKEEGNVLQKKHKQREKPVKANVVGSYFEHALKGKTYTEEGIE